MPSFAIAFTISHKGLLLCRLQVFFDPRYDDCRANGKRSGIEFEIIKATPFVEGYR